MKLSLSVAIFFIILISGVILPPPGEQTNDEAQTNAEVQPKVPEAPPSFESLDKKLKDAQKRLYSIEDKIDHILFHNAHDVTPHSIQFSPFGPIMMPQILDPNSAHTQMKTHDIMRSGGFGGMMGMPGMMGMSGMMGMPGMMGMGSPYSGSGYPTRAYRVKL